VLALTQIGILGVVVPIRTASSISGEKERQTFDIMMTTCMTPFSVISGKVMTSVIQSLFFVIAGMPIMAMAFVIGGISWSYLFWFLAVALLVSVFAASIGIVCSSLCKKSITAVTMSYGIYIVFFVLTAIPYGVLQVLGVYSGRLFFVSGCLFLLNPAMYLMEFFIWIMLGSSTVFGMLNISSTRFSAVESWVVHDILMAASTILFLLVSFLFLAIAAKRISPVSRRQARKLAAAGGQAEHHG
jgi:ABC-type transport system involved in multi-copper enzyme maturation permease subunit